VIQSWYSGKTWYLEPFALGPRKDVKNRDDRNIPDENLNNWEVSQCPSIQTGAPHSYLVSAYEPKDYGCIGDI
jgi:hypothetical protein